VDENNIKNKIKLTLFSRPLEKSFWLPLKKKHYCPTKERMFSTAIPGVSLIEERKSHSKQTQTKNRFF